MTNHSLAAERKAQKASKADASAATVAETEEDNKAAEGWS